MLNINSFSFYFLGVDDVWVKFEYEKNGQTKEKMTIIENGKANMFCSCGGKYTTKQTAKPVYYDGKKLYCKECGREFKIIDTQSLQEKRIKEQREERNRQALKNLHLFPAWNDWEATGQHYMLSARVDYDTWKSIKKYFHYYTRRELEESEMESFDFIKGWATRQPYEVEKILVSKGLIKEENKLDKVIERMEKERKEREILAKQKRLKEKKMKETEDKLKSFFNNDEDVVSMTEAEATHYLGRKGETVFNDGVDRFCIDGDYFVQATNMGDFSFARKVLLNDEMKSFISSL